MRQGLILAIFWCVLVGVALAQDATTTAPHAPPLPDQGKQDIKQTHMDFLNLDKNRDGYIDAGELRSAITGLQEDDVTRIFDTYDTDRDGALTFEDFLLLMKEW